MCFYVLEVKIGKVFGEMKVERVNFEGEKSASRCLDPLSKIWNRFRRKIL